ncbi:DUF4326 domain-containing protein [Streptomyces sp. NPDC060322]|uniref:DUF4326 domain-containing protein n=1 Tax=Streptomyces sp. NPDC060322 TaxID=3347097 RepID=UPI00364B9756
MTTALDRTRALLDQPPPVAIPGQLDLTRSTVNQQPVRIKRRRTKGWRKPEGAVYVGRGSKWGNPCTQVRTPALDGSEWEREGRLGKTSGQRHAFVHPDKTITYHLVQAATREQAVTMYRRWVEQRPSLAEAARTELAGKDLMCWCPVDEPCHATVLLELANAPTTP